MRNPLRSLNDFIRTKGSQARNIAQWARETVEPIYTDAPRHSDDRSSTAPAEPSETPTGEHHASKTEGPRFRVPSPEDQRHDGSAPSSESAEYSNSDAAPDFDAPLSGREQGTEESSQGDHLHQSLGRAVATLIDGRPGPVQRLHAIFQEDGRQHERRHLLVSAEDGDTRSSDSEPDVLLDVPELSLDELKLEVENLKAHIALQAEVANLVTVNVGAEVEIEEVDLQIEGVEARALLKVHLDEVRRILSDATEVLRENPELLVRALETAQEAAKELGDTAEQATDAIADATDDLDETADEVSDQAASIEAQSQVSRDS